MALNNKEIQILEHICNYCDEINKAVEFFGNSQEEFESNFMFKNTICMSMLQIGELVKNLSSEFRNKYTDVAWREFAGARDIFAHAYQKVDFVMIWSAVKTDIPKMEKYCIEILESNKR